MEQCRNPIDIHAGRQFQFCFQVLDILCNRDRILRNQSRPGSLSHPIAQFSEPVVKTFLRDPMLLAKLMLCQIAVITFLNEHCLGLCLVFIMHSQHIRHL